MPESAPHVGSSTYLRSLPSSLIEEGLEAIIQCIITKRFSVACSCMHQQYSWQQLWQWARCWRQ